MTTEHPVTYEQAVAILHQLVEEKGAGFVYQKEGNTCHNWLDGQPSCIIGHLVERLGWMPNENSELYSQTETTEVSYLVEDLDIVVDGRTFCLLVEVQSQQDNGVPWGLAVEIAINETEQWEETDVDY